MIKEMMSSSSLDEVVVFFYNPNIHPRKEYEIRKEENMRFCTKLGIEFVDADYNPENWHTRTKGMELDPERGRRCTACFDMRMERTAHVKHCNPYVLVNGKTWENVDEAVEKVRGIIERNEPQEIVTFYNDML
jgi:predicted adenine nucleotide alpha hydrolase (AANH) superfamily ATPase